MRFEEKKYLKASCKTVLPKYSHTKAKPIAPHPKPNAKEMGKFSFNLKAFLNQINSSKCANPSI
jgi:hypothetical protein